MKSYYRESYPMEAIKKMLLMGGTAEFFGKSFRVVAFSYDLEEYGYPRKTFKEGGEMERAVKEKMPTQIHFQSLQTQSFYSEHVTCETSELVFDIDVTDFKRYCPCTTLKDQKQSCRSCWQHIEGASLVLEYLLEQEWGIKRENILWVLSGMKGFHCIVNDKRFLFLRRKERSTLFYRLQKTSNKELIQFASTLKIEFTSLLMAQFRQKSVQERSLVDSDKFQQSCLSLIRTEYFSIYNALSVKWFNLRVGSSSEDKWNALLELERGQFPNKPLPSLVIALQCYYPMIDKGPFCEKNHLFKLPFSIHTKTRRIALPVERESIMKGNEIPTLSEVNAHYRENGLILPLYLEGIRIFERWVSSYSVD